MAILSWGSLSRLLFIGLLVSAPPLAADSVKIFVAKKIITMEAERDLATAVAVAKGRVIAIGDADELRKKLQKSLAEPVQSVQGGRSTRFAHTTGLNDFVGPRASSA